MVDATPKGPKGFAINGVSQNLNGTIGHKVQPVREDLMKTLFKRSLLLLVGAGLLSLVVAPAFGQGGDPLLTPPPNVVLPNANGVPVGPFGGLEGGAYVARVDDPSSAWFNPAGLSRAKTGQISGSAG